MAAPRHLHAAGPAGRTPDAWGKCPRGGRDGGGERVGSERGRPLPLMATLGSDSPGEQHAHSPGRGSGLPQHVPIPGAARPGGDTEPQPRALLALLLPLGCCHSSF